MEDAECRGVENAGAYRVPLWKYQEGEGRKGKDSEGVGERGRNEVGQLGCTSIKEVGENGGIGPIVESVDLMEAPRSSPSDLNHVFRRFGGGSWCIGLYRICCPC